MPHGHGRQHTLLEVHGHVGHPPAQAARAEAALFARERHERWSHHEMDPLQRYYRGSTVAFVPRGNPAAKLAISVDRDVHAKVLKAAEAEGVSVSAWMTAAARRALRLRDGLAGVAEWEAEHGPLTQAELDAARHRIVKRSRPAQRIKR